MPMPFQGMSTLGLTGTFGGSTVGMNTPSLAGFSPANMQFMTPSSTMQTGSSQGLQTPSTSQGGYSGLLQMLRQGLMEGAGFR